MKTIIQRFFNRFARPTPAGKTPFAPKFIPQNASAVEAKATGQQLHEPDFDDAPAQCLTALCTATDQTQALRWLERLQSDTDLAAVALRARIADIRAKAVQQISDESVLKRLAEQTQHKDKTVHRLCQHALKAAAAMRQRQAQVATLERKLDALLANQPLPPGRRFELQQALNQLTPGEDLQNCRQLLQEALKREAGEAELLRELNRAFHEADGIRKLLADDPILQGTEIEELRRQVATLREQLLHGPAWLSSHKQGAKVLGQLSDIEQRLNIATADATRMEECQRFLAAQATASMTKVSCNAWAAMPKPSSPAALAALEAQWESLRLQQQHVTRPDRRPVVRQKSESNPFDRAGFIARLEQMEQAIEDGETVAARRLSRTLQDSLGDNKLDSKLATRHRQAMQSLNRLRGWARWSGVHVRTELLEAAEALITEPLDHEELRRRVPQLRGAWNRLNQQEAAPVPLQERFNNLLTQAFQPILEERAAAAAQRAEVRAAHTACLEEWETWLEQIDWNNADLLTIQKQWQAIRTERRRLPTLTGPDARRSSRRFAAISARIKSHMDPISQAEVERREGLIAAALRLQDMEDLEPALNQARRLQKRWREEAAHVLLRRQTSEALWQRFREAIDIVYARRTAQRSAEKAVAEQQQAQREQLFDAFASAIDQAQSSARILEAQAQFETDWDQAMAASGADPRSQTRIQELLSRAQSKLVAFDAARQQAFFGNLAEKAALAERLEQFALGGMPDPDVVSEIEAQWKALPAVPGGAERLLEARFLAASTATDERLEYGLDVRGTALLDLEIWLDIPTPETLMDLRRQRQLQLLQSGKNRSQTEEQLRAAVARWYATTARPDAGQQARMARVVECLSKPQRISA